MAVGSHMVQDSFLGFFWADGAPMWLAGGELCSASRRVAVRNGIPRFTPDISYSSGNFGRLRERHATLQLDSRNGTSDRRQTVLSRTNWGPEFFRGRVVLECGCGAGPDTEILLSLGATVVAVDIAGADVAARNIGPNPRVQFIQASITDLPLRRQAFDIVFCHRVLQHTPDPPATLEHILQFVKEDGAVFVHSYAPAQRWIYPWKYALRPLTARMNPNTLYEIIRGYAKPAYHATNLLNRTRLGRAVATRCIPFFNHRRHQVYAGKNDAFFIEYGIHDTFDALSPAYDKPIDPLLMETIARRILKRRFEVVCQRTITLLRTLVPGQTTSGE